MSLRRNNGSRFARVGLRIAACALALVGFVSASAQPLPLVTSQPDPPRADDPGLFNVLNAAAAVVDGVYYLDASVAYRLSAEAHETLLAGVPLTLGVDVEIVNPRRFWFDNAEASLRQRFELSYRAVSQRFVVQNLNSGDQESFPSLVAALGYIGDVRRLPLIDADLLDDGETYQYRLRAVLDVERFPGPLRFVAFWRRDWSLASSWVGWQLPRD